MTKRNVISILAACALFSSLLSAQEKKKRAPRSDGPQPRVVSPGGPSQAPSDASILFDGKNMSGWRTRDGGPAKCTPENGEMVCKTGSGDIYSVEKFKDAQIHLEFAVPHMPAEKGQRRGNSGVFLHSCYEVQILDSFENPTYADGSLGGLYGVSAPMVNAARKPGEWQSYDMIFRAPRCDTGGNLTEPGRLTALLNGVLVQDHVAITKKGSGCRHDNICDAGPLRLQDHSGFPGAPVTVMKFRNVWIRKLE
ncbi:MAG: DUF1080 domain-containing protein [Candidatus Solibacter usitatus]|nr:DUF1080 domain-containing protein [Candidatus Solibacter usitatus]